MARRRPLPFSSPLQTPKESFLFGILLGVLVGLGGGVYLTHSGINLPLVSGQREPEVSLGESGPVVERDVLVNKLRTMSPEERDVLRQEVERPYRARTFEPVGGGRMEAVQPDDSPR